MDDVGYCGWRIANRGLTVGPQTNGNDAVDALSDHNPALARTMAPTLVATARYARPYLSIVPRDAIVAAVEQIDARLAPPATMAEYPPVVPSGKRLFRYVAASGEEIVAMAVPDVLITEHVRALWWELAEAIEAESRNL